MPLNISSFFIKWLMFDFSMLSLTIFTVMNVAGTIVKTTMAIMYFVIKEDYIGQESYAMIESMLPMLLGGKSLATVIASIVVSLISFFILISNLPGT